MPLQGSFRISKALSDVAQQYSNYEYVFASALPDKMVKEESGQYYIYNNDLRIPGNTLRANGAPAHEVTFDMSTSTYNVREHGVQHLITDRDYENTDSPPIQLDRDFTEYLADKLLLQSELETMQLMFTTTSFNKIEAFCSDAIRKLGEFMGTLTETIMSEAINLIERATTIRKEYSQVAGSAQHLNRDDDIVWTNRRLLAVT